MELNPPNYVPPAGDDFVHIDPNVEALSESIVNVEEELGGDNAVNYRSGEDGNSEQGRVLPEEFSKTVLVLACDSSAESGKCDVYLESCREVQAIVSHLKPQVVFLELCSSRVAMLSPQDLKVANKLEVLPGSEFRVAFDEAMKYGGKVILGDRPVQITLRRTWGRMPLWHKAKLFYSLFQAFFLPSPEDLNKMLKEMYDVDMLTLVIQEMSKEFPTLMETLVHERDQYMSSRLLRVASEHSSVVAVVGRGHLNGIKKYWKQPVVVKDLLEISSPKSTVSALNIVTSVGAVVAGIAIISGIYLNCRK